MLQERIVPGKPALFVEGQKKYLVVTDLHIGFESNLTANEIFIGKNTAIKEITDELLEIVDSKKPDALILLGDVKSSIKNISKGRVVLLAHLYFRFYHESTPSC